MGGDGVGVLRRHQRHMSSKQDPEIPTDRGGVSRQWHVHQTTTRPRVRQSCDDFGHPVSKLPVAQCARAVLALAQGQKAVSDCRRMDPPSLRRARIQKRHMVRLT